MTQSGRNAVDFAARRTTKDDNDRLDGRTPMNRWIASLPPSYARWCGYLLLLLAPGSFVVLPAIWFIRLRREARVRTPSTPPRKACADALRP